MTGKSLISDEYMSDIADAIRQKKGTSGTIKTYELADEIASITGGGVELSTSLSITSDNERTTGAVTLTTELTASDYVGVSDVNLNGHLENAPINLYKNNTLLATQNTNSNGVATFNQTINEDTTFTATYDGESGKYETSTATKTIEYDKWKDTYQPVEWIESNGTQWINTGVNDQYGYRVVLDMLKPTSTSSDRYFFGAYRPINGIHHRDYLVYKNNRVSLHLMGDLASYYSFQTNTRHTLEAQTFSGEGYLKIDNVTQKTFTSTFTRSDGVNLYLFGDYSDGSVNIVDNLRVYSCKIYDKDDNLVRDFKPCYHIDTGVIGLYDTVTSTFYDNDGAGTFTKGNDIN